MKKIILSMVMVALVSTSFAQDAEKENLKRNEEAAAKKTDDVPNGWKKSGNITMLFNQAAFNKEWTGGGVSSMGANFGLNYDFNYKMDRVVWDNKLIFAYGLTKAGDNPTAKTDDRIEWNSLWGKKAGTGNWYYSAFANFRTQMDAGIDAKTNVRTTHFFSPAFLQVGPGMLWKKSDNLKVNIAPATSRFTFVDGDFTKGLPTGVTYFGVEGDKSMKYEFGMSVYGYYKTNLIENVSMENILSLYSNYLDKPQNMLVDYQMNLVMKINKYMSANISMQAIYAEKQITKTQVREVFGLGINYGF